MRPSEFFDVGDTLATPQIRPAEGCGRSAISRYYYAAFLEARNQLKARVNLVFKAHQVHDGVVKAFYFADPPRTKSLGRLLGDLRKMRVDADYKEDLNYDPTSVAEARIISQRILAELAAPDFDYSPCRDYTRA